MTKVVLVSLFGFLSSVSLGQAGQGILSTTDIMKYGLVSLLVSDCMIRPELSAHLEVAKPVPFEYYRSGELSQQLCANEQSEWIVSNTRFFDAEAWDASEEITPFTWKWVDLEMRRPDGFVTYMSLRRPNGWFKQKNVAVGKEVHFDWEDVGATGWAIVRNIRPNQFDSRLLNHETSCVRPIVGKFQHTSNRVFDITFDNGAPIGVTDTHPIWSSDRRQWVKAVALRIGERVATELGETTVTSITHRPGIHTVYNIEVFKSHNYHVSGKSILVHNGPCGIGFRTVAEVVGAPVITYKGKTYKVVPNSLRIRPGHVEHYANLMKEGKFDWNDMRETTDFMTDSHNGGKQQIIIYLTPDGRAVITEGHTRYTASRLAGVDIPLDNPNAVDIREGDFSGGYEWKNAVWDHDPLHERGLEVEKMVRGYEE